MGERKPNSSSVTNVPCSCGFLERDAKEPEGVIHFDEATREYQIVSSREGMTHHMVIYHCPFCGGAAPPSKRDEQFEQVSEGEAKRIFELFAGLQTLDAVIAKFGPPDQDIAKGTAFAPPGSATRPSRESAMRTLVYRSLSETANVRVVDVGPEKIRLTLSGKYRGDRS